MIRDVTGGAAGGSAGNKKRYGVQESNPKGSKRAKLDVDEGDGPT